MSVRMVTFGDICEFKYGKALSAQVRKNGDVAVFGSNGQVGTHDLPLSTGPTIIIGRKGSVGEVNYYEGPNWPIDTTYYIDQSATECHLRWLAYALKASRIRTLNKAAAVPGLNRNDAYLERVALPPLDEQKRIAAILDKADALRAKRRQAIALLDNLTQSIFLEMFGDPVSNPKGWPTLKLSDVAEFFAGNSLPEGLEFKGQCGGYLQLKVSDLNRTENAEHVVIAASFSDKPGSRSGTAPAGAIVFPKRGGAIATNKKRTLARPAILDPNLMGVAPKPQHLNSPFLAAWFKFLDLASISSGSSVPQLNKQDLAPLDISVPPLQLQEAYEARKDQLSKIASPASASFFASDRLFASLQHRAFTGQL